MVPIAEDPAEAAGPIPADDSDLDHTDDEADDLMRPAVLAMPSIAPPAFASRMPQRSRRAPPHEREADYPLDEEEALHEPPPKWRAAGDEEPGGAGSGGGGGGGVDAAGVGGGGGVAAAEGC